MYYICLYLQIGIHEGCSLRTITSVAVDMHRTLCLWIEYQQNAPNDVSEGGWSDHGECERVLGDLEFDQLRFELSVFVHRRHRLDELQSLLGHLNSG